MPIFVIEQYKAIVQMIGRQFGDSCQAILYIADIDRLSQSGAVQAVSGNTTDARPSDPLPLFLIDHIQEKGFHSQYGFINKGIPGLVLRTSLQFIPVDDKKAGVLCIHHNIVHIKMITSFLEELTRPSTLEDEDERSEKHVVGDKQYVASDIQGFLDSIISEFIIERLGTNSFISLEKGDKLALISELDNRGVFLVKGAVNTVAKRINVSKFSIYNYLEEIRTIDG